MCIVAAKWFTGIGWAAVKNRDRNYIPEISFKDISSDGVEILMFWDNITQYCEGLNSGGVCILSASLMVKDDEVLAARSVKMVLNSRKHCVFPM